MKRLIVDRKKKEGPKRVARTLLFFFSGSFVIEFVMGNISGSHVLIISGMFLLFGIFVSTIILLRTRAASNVALGVGSDFSMEKLEYIVVAGISLLIAVSAGMLLNELVHLIFFHRLHPPGLLAAWTAAVMIIANQVVVRYLKRDIADLEETDKKSVLFLFSMDSLLSMGVILVVLIARAGLFFTDYLFATVESIFMVIYSIHFLKQSYSGLMNASCDPETLATITRFIKKADPSVRIKSLKVNRAGIRYQIMATIGIPSHATLTEAKIAVKKIEGSLVSGFHAPYELHIGCSD